MIREEDRRDRDRELPDDFVSSHARESFLPLRGGRTQGRGALCLHTAARRVTRGQRHISLDRLKIKWDVGRDLIESA